MHKETGGKTTMPTHDALAPEGDRPITSEKEDKLNRTPFVRALANHLSTARTNDSLVLALYGPWGSGKTSILNMVEEEVTKNPDVTLLRFNPWLFSGTEQLVGHFFRDLAVQLLEKDANKYQDIANALESYGTLIGPFGTVPVVGPWLKATTGISDILKRTVQQKAQLLPISIESQRKHIISLLSATKQRVIILIDDIDRLRHDEIRDTMRLVRLVADFPNIRYLLAFDRQRVVEALAGTEGNGQAYLEKIVQATFDVPQTAAPDLAQLLADTINAALAGRSQSFSHEDLQNLFSLVIRPLFSTAREVRRYANCLSFSLDLMSEEVSIPDILTLEAIRTIHPEFIEGIPSAFNLLTEARDAFYDRIDQQRQQAAKDSLAALAKTGGRHNSTLQEAIKRLFPASRSFTNNHFYGPEGQARWRKERRVAHPEVLQFYLEKSRAEGTLPTPVVREAFEALGSPTNFSVLLNAIGSENLGYLFKRLLDYHKDLPVHSIQAAVEGLLRAVPMLSEQQSSLTDLFGPDTDLLRLVFRLIQRAGPSPAPLEVTERALLRIRSLSAKCSLISIVGEQSHEHETIGTPADRERLAKELAWQIAMTPAKELSNERQLFSLLQVVKEYRGSSEEFFQQLLESDEFLLQLLRAGVSEKLSQTAGDAAVRREHRLAWDALCILVGHELLRNSVLRLNNRAPHISDQRARLAFELASQNAKSHGGLSIARNTQSADTALHEESSE
jgi:hypothetical protein